MLIFIADHKATTSRLGSFYSPVHGGILIATYLKETFVLDIFIFYCEEKWGFMTWPEFEQSISCRLGEPLLVGVSGFLPLDHFGTTFFLLFRNIKDKAIE